MGTRINGFHTLLFGATAAVVVALLVLGTAHATPLTLTEGRVAVFTDKDKPSQDKARFSFKNDPALFSLISPLCPAASEIRIVASNGSSASLTLDCSRWDAKGTTFRYSGNKPTIDSTGVRVIRYGLGKLIIMVKGENYAANPIAGPTDWIETTFSVDGRDHCGRWGTFRKNEANRIIAGGPTLPCEIVCGDGDLDSPFEECDDGNQDTGDGCGSSCQIEVCGDGVHTPPIEQCDDGNAIDGDGCDTNCTTTGCGNDITSAGEQCDDGNTQSGDGCSADCTLEVCGDGILDAGEDCDDGGTEDGDCCSATCTFETDACSDGNNCTEGDHCEEGACVGAPLLWINEFDYDDWGANLPCCDDHEFIEITGPAGIDLGGYQVIGVEGSMIPGTTYYCDSPGGILPGSAHWIREIPDGTVLADDTGTGVGFLVVCFAGTSSQRIARGQCDVVFETAYAYDNIQDGHNSEYGFCPDGLLLLDPTDNFVDAVSYEGVVPNVGVYGPFFQITPYSAGKDEGFGGPGIGELGRGGISLEKTTNLGRAVDASEWRDSGDCDSQHAWEFGCTSQSATPGLANPGQMLFCGTYCGDGVAESDEECDEGIDNSDEPDATCRLDCTLRRCGDGIVDPNSGEICDADAGCGAGEHCFGCAFCESGTPLGPLSFTIVHGPDAANPPDDGESSLLRVAPQLMNISNGSLGDFTAGPLSLSGGVPDPNSGIAPLIITETALTGARKPALSPIPGRVCYRIRQDPNAFGFVDCDGGSNVNVDLAVNSNGIGLAGPAVLIVPADPNSDSGAGAAMIPILFEVGETTEPGIPCEQADFEVAQHFVLTTGTSTATISNARGTSGVVPFVQISQTGQPFDCGNWTADSGASLTVPNANFDIFVVIGTIDIAQVLRLNDD